MNAMTGLVYVVGEFGAMELITVVVALVLGAVGMFMMQKLIGSKTILQAKEDAQRVLNDARQEGEVLKRQMELDGRKELIAKREEFDEKMNQLRAELKDTEREQSRREDNLDRKLDVLLTKEKHLDQQEGQVKKREQDVERMRGQVTKQMEEQREVLLRLSKLGEEEAKQMLLERVEQELRHEAGEIVQKELGKAHEEAKENARKITIQAIQRYAAEHTSTSTVSAVAIPSDDMKGRVIGREGRNIRAFEQATGVDVIVDDTPGVVVVSCFDPIRRAVAAESLQKLIDDGRIHPARIEEIVEQTREDIQEQIIKYGKDASIEADVQGLHPKILEMVGRLHYRTSYGQNILRHSIEVAYLCQVMANELGLDGAIARRCGLLHDIGKAMDHEVEGGHPAIGMEFCRKFNEREEVLNAIGGHHGDIEASSHYTPIVAAADAISGSRPGARRETLERYIKRLEQLETIATSFEGVAEAYAIQAGREVRVIVNAKRVDDAASAKVAHDIAKRVEEEMTYPGEVRVTVLREVRNVEYAR